MTDIIELFENSVKENHDRSAVVCGSDRVTYGELDSLSSQVAARLTSLGARAGDAVAVDLPRGIAVVAVLLGALKARVAFVSLAAGDPQERRKLIMEDCGVKFVIDANFIAALDRSAVFEPLQPQPDDAALMVCTSGSTGRPKSILHDRESLNVSLQRLLGVGRLSKFDKSLSIAGLTAVAGLMCDVFKPLVCGCELHMLGDELRGDLRFVSDYAQKNGITSLFMAPQMLHEFKEFPPSLRLVFTAGDKVVDIPPRRGCDIIVMYGQSESCGVLSSFVLDKTYPLAPIGRAAEGLNLYILDEEGRRLPAGSQGEICFSGRFARCYIGLPEKTAQTFSANPWAAEDGNGTLLRTGDLGYIDEEDLLWFVNRKDWMIKINGQRIEPGEIEAAVKTMAGVTQAAAKGFQSAAGRTYIAAYYTTDADVKPEEVKEYLAAKLPAVMRPSFLVRLDKFPLNANGKLDRKVLAAPDVAACKKEYAAPVTETEKLLCGEFSLLLGVENIGLDDDFFALGGDSILAMRLTVFLAEKLAELPVSELKDCPTPRLLAARLSAGGREPLPPIEEADGEGPFEMSDEIRAMARIDARMRKAGAFKEFTQTFRIGAPVDMQKLRAAAEAARVGIDAFRLVCDVKNEQFVPAPEGEFGDLRIDIRAAGRDADVTLSGSHLLFDAMSLRTALAYMASVYNGQTPPRVVSCRAYAAWLKKIEATERWRNAERYWRSLTERTAPLSLQPSPDASRGEWDFLCSSRSLPDENFSAKCREYGCTRYEYFFTVFHRACVWLYGNPVISGSAASVRSVPQAADAAGCLANRFYTFVDFEPDEGFAVTLAKVKKSLADGQENIICAPQLIIDPNCCGYPYRLFHYEAPEFQSPLKFGSSEAYFLSANENEKFTSMPLVLIVSEDTGKIGVTTIGRAGITNKTDMEALLDAFTRELSAAAREG